MLIPQRVVEDLEALEREGVNVGWRSALALCRAGIVATQEGVEFDSIWQARRVVIVCGVPLWEPCLLADKWLEECSRLYNETEYYFLRLVAWTNDGAAMERLLRGDFSGIDGTAAYKVAKYATRAQIDRIADFLGRCDEPKISGEAQQVDGLEDCTIGIAAMGASNFESTGLTLADWYALPRGKAYSLLRKIYADSAVYKDRRASAEVEYNMIYDGLKNG